MKPHTPHPRIRKTIKWGGAAVTVLLVVMWLVWAQDASYFKERRGLTLGVLNGSVGAQWLYGGVSPNPPVLLGSYNARFRVIWGLRWYSFSGGWALYIPLWPVIALSICVTTWAWCVDTLARRHARLTPHLCPKCNYDRAGLGAGAKCPECGTGGTPA